VLDLIPEAKIRAGVYPQMLISDGRIKKYADEQ
jgi:hypothetical protein